MYSAELIQYLNSQSSLESIDTEDIKSITEQFPWFQAGWLIYLKKLKNIDSELFDEVSKKVSVVISNQKLINTYLNSDQQELTVQKETRYLIDGEESGSIPESDSLIDRFLKSGNTSLKVKSDQLSENTGKVNPEEISATVSDDMITETLAAIYRQQKNYEKAQKAYEKLSLKYPEKSIYFASQIKEIEILKNKNT